VKSSAGYAGARTSAKPLPRLIRNTQALKVNHNNLADVEAYYEYLAEHETIMEKLDALKE
jgi:hypothetical protein